MCDAIYFTAVKPMDQYADVEEISSVEDVDEISAMEVVEEISTDAPAMNVHIRFSIDEHEGDASSVNVENRKCYLRELFIHFTITY